LATPSRGTINSPAPFVTDDRVTPVAGAVTVTVAPGTADPVASRTVPEILPVACPKRSCPEAKASQDKRTTIV
jgi:hypothetical protein